jgi:hypothetical protein
MKPMACLTLIALAGCASPVMNPDGDLHERVVFSDPVQVVMYVYQNLEAGRLNAIGEAFLNYTDRAPWIARAESGEPHPWSQDPETSARVYSLRETPEGELLVSVLERWSGGETDRVFRCRRTADGWRIVEVEGVPGDGMLLDFPESEGDTPPPSVTH